MEALLTVRHVSSTRCSRGMAWRGGRRGGQRAWEWRSSASRSPAAASHQKGMRTCPSRPCSLEHSAVYRCRAAISIALNIAWTDVVVSEHWERYEGQRYETGPLARARSSAQRRRAPKAESQSSVRLRTGRGQDRNTHNPPTHTHTHGRGKGSQSRAGQG